MWRNGIRRHSLTLTAISGNMAAKLTIHGAEASRINNPPTPLSRYFIWGWDESVYERYHQAWDVHSILPLTKAVGLGTNSSSGIYVAGTAKANCRCAPLCSRVLLDQPRHCTQSIKHSRTTPMLILVHSDAFKHEAS